MPTEPSPPPQPQPDATAFKSRDGIARVLNAMRYSLAGLRAALRHEAAFRQELALGLPLILLAPFLAPGRWQLLVMVASVVAVLIVELMNSAIEALADAISLEDQALLGRAKDLGSAAVMLALLGVPFTWGLVLLPNYWPRFG